MAARRFKQSYARGRETTDTGVHCTDSESARDARGECEVNSQ
jgi:hypothetical protein